MFCFLPAASVFPREAIKRPDEKADPDLPLVAETEIGTVFADPERPGISRL
jgi:hypothetical protein